MKVPVCFLCHKIINLEEEPEDRDGWIEFSDCQPSEGLEGPTGMEWFCIDHYPAAEALSHLSSQEALAELQRQFGVFPKLEYVPPKMTWKLWLKGWWDVLRW